MAFLFKSKKGQDRALASRDGHSGSQSSIQSGGVRAGSLDKNPSQARATPTGSMTSTENDGTNGGSPEQGHQRGTSTDQSQPQSDLQVRLFSSRDVNFEKAPLILMISLATKCPADRKL